MRTAGKEPEGFVLDVAAGVLLDALDGMASSGTVAVGFAMVVVVGVGGEKYEEMMSS